MNSERLKIVQQFVEEDPTDPFNHYALAMELKASDPEGAEKIFDYLLTVFPDYLPTYYQAALLKIELSQNEQSAKIIDLGMEVANNQHDSKTANELNSLKNELD